MDKRWLVIAALLAVVAAGCRGVERPNWLSPGRAEVQQARAQEYDPWPEPETGPAIVGGRPMDYQKPPAEVLRVQPRRDDYGQSWGWSR
jgi:hypothetical protein